ncbi:MAG: PAS domain S-box protein [Gammaproteobacteria bacterium]|uniref:two-component system sensor histidine kinase NtrB n=1 Tax=Rhodoferax sp. TaxID=50421 RepID=UPI001DB2C137|nr:ATP-binding protein [Rhodoferax sp.]MBU3897973.1 PAS domain S-box protein [Gammaproteobacteria bacterium]MBU3998904.1 PAS domain S-box protein [Gammaproteobacteria bacterium]MBU4018634.1 PAS domain S-box protein [Gammaproteobacteria bacterium]MBU4080869.1 PAS domain S-box protein [Gammaproteobacteria bacterium]MBU4112630.1 PAS domain S-box protein [Gammaproteobacteria bacterium]
MTRTEALPTDQTRDFALLQQLPPGHVSRNLRTLLWLLGLLLLLVGAVVTLVLYLSNFEAEEETRRRAADAQWLEQSVQFHFRRLEDDLLVLARHAALGDANAPRQRVRPPEVLGGLLWREPGVVLSHGWLAAGLTHDAWVAPERWQLDWAAHLANAQALATMQDTTRGLRRSAYAGLMQQSDGSFTDVVWLAVPFFDRGQFVGNYLAALSLERAVRSLVPAWFAQGHSVRLVVDEMAPVPVPAPADHPYRASMNLPGSDLFLEVASIGEQPTTVPRIFFLVALLFLTGMLTSLVALRRDFIKRQQVQARLQAEVALRTAMENSVTIGLRAWDQHGKILYVNQAFCSMVGYAVSELVGRSAPLPYWPADQADELQLVHRDVIAQGTQGDGVELQFQHRNGPLLDVLIHEAPLTTTSGEQLGWMSSVLDISERKRAQRMAALQQDKLEASGRLVAVGEVASTLAHELNQPLGALSSFANGLLNRLRGGNITLNELEPVVTRMARLAERAGGIIKRVNAFARRRELSRQRLELAAVLRRVLASMGDVQSGQVSLVNKSQSIWIDADELMLEHLINNLVANALDWAHRGTGLAQVRVEVAGDWRQGLASLTVADSGPGVAQEDRDTIFNAFFSTKEGGMGMGLAICRSIVEAHHGRIEVGCEPELGGARFVVWLPLADGPSVAPTLPTSLVAQGIP